MFAGGTDFDLANKLVSFIRTGRKLIAKVRFAVFLGSTGIDILLPTFGRRPVYGGSGLFDQLFFCFSVVLLRYWHDAGINHLPTTGDVAVLFQLVTDGIKQGFTGSSCVQSFPKCPERGAIRDLAAVAQTNKTLKTQAIQ